MAVNDVSGQLGAGFRPMPGREIQIGCAPCKARELQEKSEKEFKERYGHIKLVPANQWPR